MAGFWKLVYECLADHSATAHRPAVPPHGERTVIVIIAIAVVLAVHFSSLGRLPKRSVRLRAKTDVSQAQDASVGLMIIGQVTQPTTSGPPSLRRW